MSEFLRRTLVADVPTWAAVVICLVIWNIAACTVTVLDKRAAQRRERRTPERRFIFFAATLGGVGVLVGFYASHHKIRKGYLMAGVWALTLAWAAVIAVLLVGKFI